ncbi:MAG: DHCW motif cupin fold protein [Crocinitomicaceae bacterium]|jgi:quercetin dioxygenase-like cupin family protein|nr:DHCW motif cupin fold protein [Crocinitomicaceae bacterium]MBK9592548.1 DHCW motif cupin fold protein [Crocinitomicaceae bacterium]
MNLDKFLPVSFDWNAVPNEKAVGMRGFTSTKIKTFGNVTVRRVEYSPEYVADHWCDKGHVIFILEGQLIVEHKGGSIHSLHAGMVYMVGDDSRAHKAKSKNGAVVFIVD